MAGIATSNICPVRKSKPGLHVWGRHELCGSFGQCVILWRKDRIGWNLNNTKWLLRGQSPTAGKTPWKLVTSPRVRGWWLTVALFLNRCLFASFLTIALQTKLVYLTSILEVLTRDLMEQCSNMQPKLMLRRTESVVEKLLTNWMSVCLSGFLRVGVTGPCGGQR